MVQKSHGASTVRIHGIGPGEILTPTVIQYDAATEVEDSTRREAARAIERIQARLIHWPIGAYARGCGRWRPGWKKARKRVGVTAVEATQIIGLGARQGDLRDQCNYPQRQNRPEQPGLRHLGNASCEHNVLVFHKLISFLVLAFLGFSSLRSHFWPFADVQNGNQREVMRKMQKP